MGIFDFVVNAGQKMFGSDDNKAEIVRTPDMAREDKTRGETLARMIGSMELGVKNLDVQFREGVVTVKGSAASQADREKAILLLGNTQGVAKVDDRMTVDKPEPEARMYTVVAGDSLSKIARKHYGSANKYTVIFEANRPMLKDPDKIYPGQVLRIPPVD